MKHVFLLIFLFAGFGTKAQFFNSHHQYTYQDTLRGSITSERAWWDVSYYDLYVAVDIDNKFLKGTNYIEFTALESHDVLQIDLQKPMNITAITHEGAEVPFDREGNAFFVRLPQKIEKGTQSSITVSFEGQPKISTLPPWIGGFTWKKDKAGNHHIANANQGDGASLWWPCKDHGYDEADSLSIAVNVPKGYTDVSNGILLKTDHKDDGTTTFHWHVSNPINNYGVNISIAKYAHFGEVYNGLNGPLAVNYYVLSENLEKAKEHFKQVPQMLEAFEHWFGPYPFYEDGFKLIEVPYLGMEHQSAVTYGNGYQNGYRGRDRSNSGYGLLFDFIIIHEAGHEWFANSISHQDVADLWIHESFTAYSESLFLEYFHGKEAGAQYNIGKRLLIANDRPIQGTYGVHQEGSSDMYMKGANMLHMLRQVVPDSTWLGYMRGLNETFFHKTVSSTLIEQYTMRFLELDLRSFFNQYLRDTRIPILEYRRQGDQLVYRWTNCVDDFSFPIRISVNGESLWIEPSTQTQTIPIKGEGLHLVVDENFYVGSLNLSLIHI